MSYWVTVAPDGQVVVESEGAAETAALVRELRNGKKLPRAARKKPAAIESVDVPLSPALVQTWNWLVAHDNPQGCDITEVAEALGLKEATAAYRLNELRKKELVHKTRPRCYRAGG